MSAFSNGTEWDAWADRWCRSCTKDSMGQPPAAPEVFCPIVTDALSGGGQPEQWQPTERFSAVGPYTCTAYEPRDPDVDVRTYVGPDGMRSAPE